MAATGENSHISQDQRGWLATVSRNPAPVAWILFGVAVVLAGVAGWLVVGLADEAHGANYWVGLWLALLALLLVGAGLSLRLPKVAVPPSSAVDRTRLLVLTLGGLAGLLTVLLAVALAYEWWDIFNGGLEAWRKEWWRLTVCLLALFGGLIVMFVSLQLARVDERSNAGLRRLLYGYNTVLTGILLLAILVICNLLTYVRLPPFNVFNTPTDWTASNIYTLSPASQGVLANLKQTVQVYVLLPTDSLERQEMTNLIDNARAVTDKIEVRYVSPDSPQVGELRRKYHFLESEGLLLVYGNPPQEEHEFINYNDLFEDRPGTRQFLFKGEGALVGMIGYLAEGKSRPVVYFTQGNGELDLNDRTSKDAGLGVLKQRLEANYDVKELKLNEVGVQGIPEDAAVVVIARPSLPNFPTQALEAYMNGTGKHKTKGKLLVLMDVVLAPDQTMLHTGLEDFLAKFGVHVRNDQIINPKFPESPLTVLAVADPNLSGPNPIARAFYNQRIGMYQVRTVEPVSSRGGPPSGYQVERLFFAQPPAWSETNLRADPVDLVEALTKPERLQEFINKVNKELLSVAVAVTAPRNANAAASPHGMPPQEQEPRLVVFGDASWVTNPVVREGSGTRSYDLFASSLAWLRERPDIGITANAKERQVFILNKPPDVVRRIVLLPFFLMALGIVGLAGGIRIVRRR